ncbi:type II restriction endonuclease subunit M [Actinoplanes sp. M2I2]|uniref:type II restriction endonuclease subunit M n=1 Tax=Actinoplanes sp. M2I2 TaxID=1734444 RepID=UPI002021E54F|nr:type II restriction endonuclease subunit M [Actinoplanes sp. M2I2]
MAFNSITNYGEYISDHYLASLLKNDLEGLRKRWSASQKAAALNGLSADVPASSAQGVKALGQHFYTRRNQITEQLGEAPTVGALTDVRIVEQTRDLNDLILRALAFGAPTSDTTPEFLRRTTLDVVQLDQQRQVEVALAAAGPGGLELVVLDATWTEGAEGIVDTAGGCRLLSPIKLDGSAEIYHAGKAIEFLFACEDPPRYVLLLTGNVVLLADRGAWPRSYLAVNLTQALHTKDDTPGGELETIAALFGAESLVTFEGQNALATLVDQGYKHAVKVSKELREALRQSVELIAQEILNRIREQGADPDDLGDKLARRLTEQSLRYLYRILFLLYAEARPELGILPSKNEAYQQGYGLARLADTVSVDLPEEAEEGLYFHHSLSLLFTLVDEGHQHPHRPAEVVLDDEGNEIALDTDGIRFEALKSELFHPDRTALIGERVRVGQCTVDTRLRNKCLWQVLNLLVLTPEPTGRRGRGRASGQRGFISYAQLGINQLGAVYEGLMSYSGFFAAEDVYEVAKTVKAAGRTADGGEKEKADPSKGTWTVPVARSGDYDPKYFVMRTNPITGESERIVHSKGSFVYRLSGRERQRSASYYTPEVLTQCTVKHALAELLTEETTARDILDLTICEPALGSGAFINEAINQLADAYLDRAQGERNERLLPDQLDIERQKVKAYLALHNCYGVDLNATAVELAEVSIWLNVMHAKLEAPWFGLHLRRGNSLIGARRAVYSVSLLSRGAWRTTAPTDRPMTCADDGQVIDRLTDDEIHHFLLPAQGWGAVSDAQQVKDLVPEEREALRKWRQTIRTLPSDKKTRDRLLALAQRVERLWELTRKRIAVSEKEIRRSIDVWGVPPARPLPEPASGAVSRDEITEALYEDRESPYNRLKTVMDAWCALWFWPVASESEIAPPTIEEWLSFCEAVIGIQPVKARASGKKGGAAGHEDVFGIFGGENDFAQLATEDESDRFIARCYSTDRIAIDDRFAWWSVLTDIADREGFFHWELEFAQISTRGGFDLQVGNPPWRRPEWSEPLFLAEYEPLMAFGIARTSPQYEKVKSRLLAADHVRTQAVDDAGANKSTQEFLNDGSLWPNLDDKQTNLYLSFVELTRNHASRRGIVGLVHQDTHLTGIGKSKIRQTCYRRLKRHFAFNNQARLFRDLGNTEEYSINIYSSDSDVSFMNVSGLQVVDTLERSFEDPGDTLPPGVKDGHGGWDRRPHLDRVLEVTEDLLATWSEVIGADGGPLDAPIIRLTTGSEFAAMSEMIGARRVSAEDLALSSGLQETGAQKAHITRRETAVPESIDGVILQSPQIAPGNPLFQQPGPFGRNHRDYEKIDLTAISQSFIPRTNYRLLDPARAYVRQGSKKNADLAARWRVAIRRRIDENTERSLQAALICPGVKHVHTCLSAALATDSLTALLAGAMSSIPLDYVIKVTGGEDLTESEIRRLPMPDPNHPLASALILRTLRLNCLTVDYSPLWEQLFDPSWTRDRWTCKIADSRLDHVGPEWEPTTPLRSDYERRYALIEIDVIVAIMLGISSRQLCSIYRSQFGVLRQYEWEAFYSADGHRIGAERANMGIRQTEAEAEIVRAWKKSELTDAPRPKIPADWIKPDRESEMTHAHHEFQRRLDAGEYPDAVEP